jgi:hypothetical protein
VLRVNCRAMCLKWSAKAWLECGWLLQDSPEPCRSWLASEGCLTAVVYLAGVHQSNCGSWLACDGGLKADHLLQVYISVSAVTAAGGFAFTATPFCRRPKGSKTLCPSIRCLAVSRHALTPALLRGPAAIGHPWPGATTAASLPHAPCATPAFGLWERGNGKIKRSSVNATSETTVLL